MIIDVSTEGRARMRPQALEDLEAWLAAVDLVDEKMLTVDVRGRASEEGFEAVVRRRPSKRITSYTTHVKEYPPRSVWWYMRESG